MKKNVLKKAIPLTVAATMMNVVPVAAYDKDETVYTKVDGDGNVTYQVVSEQLKSSKKEEIKDHSDLSHIKNISGDEKYKKDGNDLTWKSKGDDIFYQGKTTRQLPITVETSYKLDGQEISPKDASGKKGHVEISFKYTNNDKHDYNGKTLYTPFTIALATTLNSDNNKNVTINNGKVVNNGENNIIVGIAAPGLYESLNLDQLKSFDEIKIEFDTTDLDIKSFYSVATPKLATADDINGMFDKIDGSFDDLNKLKDATNQLVTGTSDLSKGAKTLSDGTKTFNSGLVTANSGAGLLTKNSKSLRDGASQLASGLGQAKSSLLDSGKLDQLVSGASQLAKGSEDLAKGTDQLSAGLKQAKVEAKKGGKQLENALGERLLDAAYKQAAYQMQAEVGKQVYAKLANLQTMSSSLQEKASSMSTLSDEIESLGALSSIAAVGQTYKNIEAQKNVILGKFGGTEKSIDAALQAKTNQLYEAAQKSQNDYMNALGEYNSLISAKTAYETLDKMQKQLQSSIESNKEIPDTFKKKYNITNVENIANINNDLEKIKSDLVKKQNTLTEVLGQLKTTQQVDENEAKVAKLVLTTPVVNKNKDVANGTLSGYVKDAYLGQNLEDGNVQIVNGLLSKEGKAEIAKSIKEASDGVNAYSTGLSDGFDKIINEVDKKAKNSKDKSGLVEGAHKLAEGTNTLNNGAKAFTQSSNGQMSLKDALKQLASGSSKLNAGTKEYTEGVDKLAGGVSQLTSAFTQIVNGSAQLSTGADKLASGMSEYKTTGIDKLTELADTLNGDSDTAKQLTKYADEYTYTATNKDANYTTKFVYIVQE